MRPPTITNAARDSAAGELRKKKIRRGARSAPASCLKADLVKYEKGVNRVSASRLQAMSDILGVPVSFFFDGGPQLSSSARKNVGARGQPSSGCLPMVRPVSGLT